MQGTTQQYCAAAALQKLSWVFNPQTKRWYKAASPTADSFRRVSLWNCHMHMIYDADNHVVWTFGLMSTDD